MKSRISFYLAVIALLSLLSWAGYKLFFSNDAEKMAKSLSTPSKDDLRKQSQGSGSPGGNVWTNESLRKSFDSIPSEDLKGAALIENNIKILGDLYNRGEDEELLKRALDLYDKNPDVKEYAAFLGDYYYNEGNWSEAEKYVKHLIELDPKNQFAKTTFSEILANQGRHDESIAQLKEVLAADPRNLHALMGMSSAFELKGQPEQGQRYLEEALKNDPTNGNAATALAETYLAQGRESEADKTLVQAEAADPKNAAPLVQHGDMRSSQGRPKEAIVLYKKALSVEPTAEGKLIILKKIVTAGANSGDLTTAKEALAQIHEFKPNSFEEREAQRQIASVEEAMRPVASKADSKTK